MLSYDNDDNERSLLFYSDKKHLKDYKTIETTKDIVQNENGTNSKYPVGVIFLLFSKFFESFSANGVRTILALYLRDSLNYSESVSTLVLHSFNFFGQFCPIFGGILADSYLGNGRTIFWFLILYGFGWIGLIIANFPTTCVPFMPILFLSLILIGTGNGNIRGCITSMGGQQFDIPEQSKSLNRYFTHYIILYNLGILLSKIIPPSVRAETRCFGKNDCYLAVFGVLGMSFLLCWVIFLLGMIFYKKEQPSKQNIMVKVAGCIWHAALRKFRGRTPPEFPWIYGAIGPYSESFVDDVATYLQILTLYLPLPIYWSLLTQVDSSWTFQATQLDTNIFGVQIQADQTKALGGILLLVLILVWEKLIEPILHSVDIVLPALQSVTIGGVCAVLSFISAGLVQTKIEHNAGPPDSVLWQLPQYFLLMMAEVLISIPGLKFAFTQAPESMKSVLTATWFMNNAIGNLIVVIITEIRPVKTQSQEFFLYAFLMLCGIIVFTKISSSYIYRCEGISDVDNMLGQEELFTYLTDNQYGSTDTLLSSDYVGKRIRRSYENLPT